MEQRVLLEVKDLVKYFPFGIGRGNVVHAVNGVSFQIYAGETLALIGESGSGKTTVGRQILGMIKPTKGSIKLDGTDLTKLSPSKFRPYRKRIQIVFQDPRDSLNPRMSVGDIIEEPLRFFTEPVAERRKARVRELLWQVRLDPMLADAYPGKLSGGTQQRVGIARALATSPELVVLDEPTSELDVSVRAEIIRLLKRLQEEMGIAYLFISHDLTAVKVISHRIAIMYLGQIIEVAESEAMFEEQYHPYAKALLSSVLLPDPSRKFGAISLKGEIPSPVNLPSGCFLHPRCPYRVDRCARENPPLVPLDGRKVACWRATEIKSGNATSNASIVSTPA